MGMWVVGVRVSGCEFNGSNDVRQVEWVDTIQNSKCSTICMRNHQSLIRIIQIGKEKVWFATSGGRFILLWLIQQTWTQQHKETTTDTRRLKRNLKIDSRPEIAVQTEYLHCKTAIVNLLYHNTPPAHLSIHRKC